MNIELLKSAVRANRDYAGLISAIGGVKLAKAKPFSVTGISDGVQPAFLAALCEDYISREDDSVLLIFPEEKEASRMAEFLAESGLPALYFPPRDYNFNNVKASRDFEHERLTVLNVLASATPTVITSAPEAVLQLTVDREEFISSCINVKSMETLELDSFLERLTESGYTRADTVEGIGQFALRGGIIDIFPPIGDAVRIELFDREIDRMGNFDVLTQRFFGENLYELMIPPAREIAAKESVRRELLAVLEKHIKKLSKSESELGNVLSSVANEAAVLATGAQLDSYDKYLPIILPESACLLDYFSGLLVLTDTTKLEERARAAFEITENTVFELKGHKEIPEAPSGGIYMRSWGDIAELTGILPSVLCDSFRISSDVFSVGASFNLGSRHIPSYAGNMQLLRDDLNGFNVSDKAVAVLVSSEPEAKSMAAELSSDGIYAVTEDSLGELSLDMLLDGKAPVVLMHGAYPAGFELSAPSFALLDFSGGAMRRRASVKRTSAKKHSGSKTEAILSYADLNVGDIVVHSVYGIGQFQGIETMCIAGVTRDYVNIKYAGADKLFLPVDQLELVSKYIGAGSQTGEVKLSKMGGADWNRAKSKASASAKDMARELIELYARRQRSVGISFDSDDAMSRQFADAFEYDETDGQLSAIAEIRRDMEAACPMDRLLCGDVGYGKTEVAMRAAFKAVNSGYQVAILVPTTILAYQHYQTAISRFRGFPVTVDMLSRFRTASQQAATLRKLRRGDVDIIIGTHRLLSKDIAFAKLGLIIIDEEQRFGVAQKERLKQLSANCDVLTLTATPIPRTLNMAMSGILDMSVLEEAPGSRYPVQTYVMEHDEAVIDEAIRRELRRGGQVFYLNNNIDAVYSIAARFSRELPEARVAAAHGRMDREQLEDIWTDLVNGEIDILVSTTIIETGIDVPNANTLIIERADKYGLSQLHQIRGRVGRSSRRAYAYFTYPPMRSLSEIAVKRLEAIKEYAEFGAGFKIALRDLEIRGAGNLLGSEQHGHLDAVGYDMYIRLLNEAVVEERGETVKAPAECAVTIDCDAFLPSKYIPSSMHRMEMYKKIAHIADKTDYMDVLDELCDRFSSPPPSAVNLCKISYIRALGIKCAMSKIEYRENTLLLTPYETNVAAVTALSGAMPSLGLRMSLSGNPHAVCRLKRSSALLDDIAAVLTKYASFLT